MTERVSGTTQPALTMPPTGTVRTSLLVPRDPGRGAGEHLRDRARHHHHLGQVARPVRPRR
ncbi:MAG: hypothetical protein E6G06_14240 [Actinobacteria bacterium]|nr:MAG: hypothetical protein E6G06_14240 [Actinomycetota bacterium]